MIYLAGIVLLLVFTDSAFAAANLHKPDTSMQDFLTRIQTITNGWGTVLRGYANSLFWKLTLIAFILTMGPHVFRGPELGEIFGELIKFIILTGFFWYIIENSTDLASVVIASFSKAGAAASGLGEGLQPGDLFATGVEMAKMIWDDIKLLEPGNAIALVISGFFIELCFVFIAAFIFVTLVESYFILNAGILFLGFAGWSGTRQYAINAMQYCMSVGAKLFVLTLIVGLVQQFASEWHKAYDHSTTAALTLAGLAFLACLLCKMLPDLIGGIMSGSSSSSGGSMVGAAVGMTAMTAGIAAGVAKGVSGIAESVGKIADKVTGGEGGGGLAKSIGDSLSGGNGDPSGSPMGGGGGGNSPSGGGSGGGSDPAAASAGSRIGGSTPVGGSSSGAGSASSSSASSSSNSGTVSSSVKAAADLVGKGANAAQGAANATHNLAALVVPGVDARPAGSASEEASYAQYDAPANIDDFKSEQPQQNVIRPATTNENSDIDNSAANRSSSTVSNLNVPGMGRKDK